MNYTAKDIEKAKELKVERFNWVVRNKNKNITVFRQKPIKLAKEWVSGAHEDYDDWIGIYERYFIPIKFENEEPTSLDDIIASEKPKYERLTDRDIAVTLNINYSEDTTRLFKYAQRLWKLENKIESGELVFRGDL